MPASVKRRSAALRFLLYGITIAAFALTATACSSYYGSRGGLKPPIRNNVIERAPVGLRMSATKFNWRYIRGGTGLEVTGAVRNTTRKTQYPVVLYAMLFDEAGRAVGMGETRISPASLAPGASGTFTLVVGTSRPQRPRPIRYLRLLTNFQNN